MSKTPCYIMPITASCNPDALTPKSTTPLLGEEKMATYQELQLRAQFQETLNWMRKAQEYRNRIHFLETALKRIEKSAKPNVYSVNIPQWIFDEAMEVIK